VLDGLRAQGLQAQGAADSRQRLTQLRATLGGLNKLQHEGVDALVTADLLSGREVAKGLRKGMNASIDQLRSELTAAL
jgi:hypothetical protein